MRFFPILALAALFVVPLPSSAQSAVNELLASFQSRLEKGEEVDDLFEPLEDLESADQKVLIAQLNRAWEKMSRSYLTAFTTATKSSDSSLRNSKKQRVRELRENFMKVYALEVGPMKPKLKEVSKPAIDELKLLLAPSAEELISEASDTLKKQREAVLKVAMFRDAALEAAISIIPADTVETLEKEEAKIAEAASSLPRGGMKILEKNRRIAEKDEIPEEEVKGVEECNYLRMFVGLEALILDPKLCEASRGHSQDMAEKGFFAHESPVPGKKTPWDRAAKAGTTASGENIYAGSTSSHDANMGWFYSPGHHKNMFGGGHKRIGLGQHGGHWTQLFGN